LRRRANPALGTNCWPGPVTTDWVRQKRGEDPQRREVPEPELCPPPAAEAVSEPYGGTQNDDKLPKVLSSVFVQRVALLCCGNCYLVVARQYLVDPATWVARPLRVSLPGLQRPSCYTAAKILPSRRENKMRVSKFQSVVAGAIAVIGFSVFGPSAASADQPHMLDARGHLQQGLDDLRAAVPDKGGHRDQAVDLVQRAIDQVNQGIEFANTHP